MSLDPSYYYHEAGHAVAVVRFGFWMRSVEVFPHAPWDTVGGQVLVRVCTAPRRRTRATVARVEHAVVMVMAGDQASALYQPGRRRGGGREDQELVCQWLAWLYPEDTATDLLRRWRVFRRYTRWFLLDAWAAVEAVAQQLIQTPRLSARQVRTIMRAVGH